MADVSKLEIALGVLGAVGTLAIGTLAVMEKNKLDSSDNKSSSSDSRK